MVNKYKLFDTNLEAQSDTWVKGVVQAQLPNMPPPLSLADSQPTTQPHKSVGSNGDTDERVQSQA